MWNTDQENISNNDPTVPTYNARMQMMRSKASTISQFDMASTPSRVRRITPHQEVGIPGTPKSASRMKVTDDSESFRMEEGNNGVNWKRRFGYLFIFLFSILIAINWATRGEYEKRQALYEDKRQTSDQSFGQMEEKLFREWTKEHEAKLAKTLEDKVQSLEKEMINHRLQNQNAQRNQVDEFSIERLSNLESSVRRLSEDRDKFFEEVKQREKEISSSTNYQNAPDAQMVIDSILTNQKVDWAQKATGGEIVSYYTSAGVIAEHAGEVLLSALLSWLPAGSRYSGLQQARTAPPDVVIDSTTFVPVPGRCFAFPGGKGNITIQLPRPVEVEEVTLEHVSEKSNPHPESTPKRFLVRTLPERIHHTGGPSTTTREEEELFRRQEPFVVRGEFLFEKEQRVATYQLENQAGRYSHLPTRRITFEVLENYGGTYTCIYRLKVHGNAVSTQ